MGGMMTKSKYHEQPTKIFAPVYHKKLVGNTLIGALLFSFVGGVFYYTITAVSQDDFADVDDRGYDKRKTN